MILPDLGEYRVKFAQEWRSDLSLWFWCLNSKLLCLKPVTFRKGEDRPPLLRILLLMSPAEWQPSYAAASASLVPGAIQRTVEIRNFLYLYSRLLLFFVSSHSAFILKQRWISSFSLKQCFVSDCRKMLCHQKGNEKNARGQSVNLCPLGKWAGGRVRASL